MIYRGIVKQSRIELEGEVTLPEGTRVNVVPETHIPNLPLPLQEWLQQAREVRAQLPETSDSVEIVSQLREGCANR
jgi:hypothetical protein